MLFTTALACSLFSAALALPGPAAAAAPNYWFSFGDSYSKTGFKPNGTQPSIGNPLGNPAYPGVTATGGTNWVDVDTKVYNKSLILTYNYAYGGAVIDGTLVKPGSPSFITLTQQVEEFMTSVSSKPASAPWTSANALFSVWIGINDIGGSYEDSGDRSAFSDKLLSAYFALVSKLYFADARLPYLTKYPSGVGARNFLFINVPPIDRTPQQLATSAASQALEKSVVNTYNTKLAAKVASFKAQHSDVTTHLWDAHTAFTAVLDDPTKYGFSDATSYGKPKSFWGNAYHPSSAAHTIWGKDIAALLNDTRW